MKKICYLNTKFIPMLENPNLNLSNKNYERTKEDMRSFI